MHEKITLINRIRELEELLELSERKSDILTNLLKEASAEYGQALEKVTISEANFKAVFENAPESIYILDIDTHRILDCNPFTSNWLGYSRNELLSMTVENILEPGTTEIRQNIETAIHSGYVHIQDRQFIKKDGSLADSEVTGTVVDYQGKRCFLSLVRDITERKKVEELTRYKELFDNVSDPVFINDINGRFLEINDVACNRFKYGREKLLGMSIRDLIKPEQQTILDHISEKFRFGETVQFELEMLTFSGETIPFEFHSRPIMLIGTSAVLSVGRDLSIRKSMEEMLIKSERLSAVGEMASGVAHNFNNLLQMIMGAAEAGLSKIKIGKVRQCKEAFQTILTASKRGSDIVHRIKEFTIVGTDHGDMEQGFDVGELIEDAVEFGMMLIKDFPDSPQFLINHILYPGCLTTGKSSEIYEVLMNIIKNGLEAMPHGGALTISTYIERGYVCIDISDQGHGISEEHQSRLFQPFFTTKGQKSSGLGLASSYGIIKKHQGELLVRSRINQGTTFIIKLPLAKRLESKKGTSSDIQTPKPIRLLLIDDEVNILKAMAMNFEDSEIEIITADNAQKGLNIVYEGKIDIVLCDLGMDDMNGWEIGKTIKTYCTERCIPKFPFMLYTGLFTQMDVKKLEACGVDRVITKPIPYAELYHITKELAVNIL